MLLFMHEGIEVVHKTGGLNQEIGEVRGFSLLICSSISRLDCYCEHSSLEERKSHFDLCLDVG